jgi:3-hydroxyisobutyrate dehydrogenase-like beta-hydroxyacid dehydrogenase
VSDLKAGIAAERPPRLRVGVVGLGRMGSAMASRLLALGHEVVVWSRTPEPAERLATQGARRAKTPAELARSVGTVVSMLTHAEAVHQVCSGPDGLLSALQGCTHLSMSTLAPQDARALAALHEALGASYISAPVQGRPPMAATGQLVGWVSGPAASQDANQVLQGLCGRIIDVGAEVGQACAAKLALNLLMIANIALLAEAFDMVGEQGVDSATFAEGLTSTAFAAPLFKAIAASLLQHDDVARGSDIALVRKDLALFLRSAPADKRFPLACMTEAIFAQAEAAGFGGLDPTAVRRVTTADAAG